MSSAKRITPKSIKRKAVIIPISIILIIATFCTSVKLIMTKQGISGGLDFADNAIIGLFSSKEANNEVIELKQKTGGIMKGICHPRQDTIEILQEANVNWVRIDADQSFDIYNDDGSYATDFVYTLDLIKSFSSNGFKVMLIYSAYMRNAYYNYGYDIRTAEGTRNIQRCAKDFILAVRDYVDAIQVANECDMERFSSPFTIEQCAKYIGVIMEVFDEYKGDIVVGYNGTPKDLANLTKYLQPWMDYCDWVGVDIYIGCFDAVSKSLALIDATILSVWNMAHKPVIITEYGYLSGGNPKTNAEKTAILKEYGFDSIKDAKNNIWKLVEQLPYSFQEIIYNGVISYSSDKELADKLFSGELEHHLFRELNSNYYVIGYPHTPEGQAKFFTDTIEIFKKYYFLCGAFIYSLIDARVCYYCGFEDCPTETGWGLLYSDKTPKPSYYAVKEAFANWN